MPKKVLENFHVEFLQILNENGISDKTLMPRLDHQKIRDMYKFMILARVFDDTALKLQREGRMLTYAPHRGQEAAQIGSIAALGKEDWVFPSFRENAASLMLGMPPELLFQYWAGDDRGMSIPAELNLFPVSIPVSTQIPHAVGYAHAMKFLKMKAVSLVYFSDGATSKGDFHEALNWAGTFKLPVVFLCQNNQYAISMPVSKQTAAKTLAQKALAYGFRGIRVDGNDVFAVYSATTEALERARNGEGPTFIECLTYRLADHTTADDASRYRTKEEVESWKNKDPILRLKKWMIQENIWNETEEVASWRQAEENIAQAVKIAESALSPDPKDIFKYTYEKMTKNLEKQMKEVIG